MSDFCQCVLDSDHADRTKAPYFICHNRNAEVPFTPCPTAPYGKLFGQRIGVSFKIIRPRGFLRRSIQTLEAARSDRRHENINSLMHERAFVMTSTRMCMTFSRSRMTNALSCMRLLMF